MNAKRSGKRKSTDADISEDDGIRISTAELQRNLFSSFRDRHQKYLLTVSAFDPIIDLSNLALYRASQSKTEDEIQIISFTPCSCPKILIVDDDPFNLTALEQHLNKLNFKCDWAFNGALAIEQIRKRQSLRCSSTKCSQYEVVFLDCNMPVMDGFETARFLRKMIADGEINDMKIIACTAFVQQSELDAVKEAGMDDFCTKPLTFQMVKEKVLSPGIWEKK